VAGGRVHSTRGPPTPAVSRSGSAGLPGGLGASSRCAKPRPATSEPPSPDSPAAPAPRAGDTFAAAPCTTFPFLSVAMNVVPTRSACAKYVCPPMMCAMCTPWKLTHASTHVPRLSSITRPSSPIGKNHLKPWAAGTAASTVCDFRNQPPPQKRGLQTRHSARPPPQRVGEISLRG
jgi:hypothetical protein